MPLPLAVPTMRAPVLSVALAVLGFVSVVMMAVANGGASSLMSSLRCSRPLSRRSIGSRCPMMPVLAVSTSWVRVFMMPPRASAMSRLSRAPWLPVAALAIPALTTSARTALPGAYSPRFLVTQAAAVVLRVPAKAQAQGALLTTQLRSVLPEGLRPAARAED